MGVTPRAFATETMGGVGCTFLNNSANGANKKIQNNLPYSDNVAVDATKTTHPDQGIRFKFLLAEGSTLAFYLSGLMFTDYCLGRERILKAQWPLSVTS